MASRRWFVVPCTPDRRAHLEHLRTTIAVNEPTARIVAVEQIPGEALDRGMLRNIGFLFCGALSDEVVCFHDVDIRGPNRYPNPQSNRSILHLYGHNHSLGGVVVMYAETFRQLGGYPSRPGWGREDVALQRFAEHAGVHIDKAQLTQRFSPGGAFVELDNITAQPLSAHAAKMQFRRSLAQKQKEAVHAGPMPPPDQGGDLDSDRPFRVLDIKRRGSNFVWVQVSIPCN